MATSQFFIKVRINYFLRLKDTEIRMQKAQKNYRKK